MIFFFMHTMKLITLTVPLGIVRVRDKNVLELPDFSTFRGFSVAVE